MKILIHDYAGHPFQVQFSRSLAKRGYDVLHVFSGSFQSPNEALAKRMSIPARGGSEGIPKKNIKQICGKPLIAWTIEAAKKSKLLDRFVVSTEDKEIAEISEKCGAEVIERPRELATDEATTFSPSRCFK